MDLSNLVYEARFGITNYQQYRYATDDLGIVSPVSAVAWAIVFPGGFAPTNGQVYASDPGFPVTYDTNALNQVEYDLRAWLRINPLDVDAATNLVMLIEDRMLPLEWSGITALTYAEKERLKNAPDETNAVELARGYFRSACDVLAQFLSNPPDAALVEGQNPLLSSGVATNVAQVLEDYLRNLSEYAQASLTSFQLRNLLQFYDPSQPQQSQGVLPQPAQALLNAIDSTTSDIQLRLLLASPFQALPAYTASNLGQVQTYLAQIARLHESVLLGRITFIAGDSNEGSTNGVLYYGEYTTSFVPIFSGLAYQGQQNSSFDVALGQALDSCNNYAAPLEQAASVAVAATHAAAYEYTSEHADLETQYLTQLVNLCGYSGYGSDGNPFPDILFAGLPPGAREAAGSQAATNGTYAISGHTGAIYEEWQALQTAETNLVYADLQLTNTMATMLLKAQVGAEIYGLETNQASMILSNGQQIAGLDVQQGEVQAQGDQAIAQINHNTAEEQAHNSFWGGLLTVVGAVAAAVLAVPSGGLSVAGLVTLTGVGAATAAGVAAAAGPAGNTIASVENAYDQASAALKIGDVQADTARQLASLNAQIEDINASQQAQMEYLQAQTGLLNLSVDLNQLGQQAQSQEVQIQLAAQAVQQERTKLATLMAQVSYLLREYTRSAALIDQNPQLSTNILVARSDAIQKADDAFVLAQQWAFLAAQAFAYKDNSPNSPAPGFVQQVLAARNTTNLIQVLYHLQSANTLLYTNAPNFKPATFSLRNNFVQANQTVVDGTNVIYLSFEPTPDGANAAASQASWTDYLSSHVFTNSVGDPVLVLDFSTSLDFSKVAAIQSNPLWTCDTYGGLIFSGTDNNNIYKGVQVNLRTLGALTLPEGSSAGFWVHLTQMGTSSVRRQGFNNQSGDPAFAMRFFNFGAFPSEFVASSTGLDSSPGTAAFDERSPANDHWQLAINGDELVNGEAGSGGNNRALLQNLDQLQDIEIRFYVKSYTDNIASQNCTP